MHIKQSDKNTNTVSKDSPKTVNLKLSQNRFIINEIKIQPDLPFTNSILEFIVFPKPKSKDIKLYYIYYVNNQKIKESFDNTFSDSFKKKDLIYADVIILKDGKEIKRVRSNIIKILNTNPVIDNISLPEIKIPGEYRIKVSAHDDDNQDEPLKLSIESTGEMPSFTIDQEEMLVTLNLKKDDFGKTYKFFIKVEDKDSGYSKREIILKLTKKIVKKKIEKKESKEKNREKENKEKNNGIKIPEIATGGTGY